MQRELEPDQEGCVQPILIVEDNAVNAMILRKMLERRGYASTVAVDGVEGVALSARLRPSLILMDLQMPRLDGFAAAAEIRRESGDTCPAIVAVTANAEEEIRGACAAAGFACVLAKPVMQEDLFATVCRLLT
jgi:CheY-like chemotaxis protein